MGYQFSMASAAMPWANPRHHPQKPAILQERWQGLSELLLNFTVWMCFKKRSNLIRFGICSNSSLGRTYRLIVNWILLTFSTSYALPLSCQKNIFMLVVLIILFLLSGMPFFIAVAKGLSCQSSTAQQYCQQLGIRVSQEMSGLPPQIAWRVFSETAQLCSQQALQLSHSIWQVKSSTHQQTHWRLLTASHPSQDSQEFVLAKS